MAAFGQGFTIREVRVEGNQRIDPETVRSYMALGAGEPIDADKVDRSLKALFATQLFADVAIRREGPDLVVRVVENPVINRIAFEGNRRFESKVLEAEIQLRARVVYTRTRVQADVQRLLQMYRRNGRFAAAVEPKIVQLPQNRVDLVFEIVEGEPTGIRRINFIGNRRFADAKLRDIVQTRESRWYRIFTTDDIYDPDRLTVDREELRRYYLSKGHADFRVLAAYAELSPDRRDFFITFALEEGEIYRFGDVRVVSEIRALPAEDVVAAVTTLQGETYDADEVERSVQALTTEVGSRGYAFADVRPEIKRDRERRIIDVVYRIGEGQRIYVERIDITGNVRTLDRVVRREFRLAEGDAFNAAKLRRSRQRVIGLGYFERVEVRNVRGSAPDKTVVAIDVREKSTGELSIGLGFSTADGLLGEIGIRERNLLGTGRDMRLGYTLSSRRTQADFALIEPYFMDRNMAMSFELMDRERNRQREASFDDRTQLGRVRTNYPLTEFLSQGFGYTLRTDTIENVGTNASRFVKRQQGSFTSSEIGHVITYDRRDNRIDPTDGYYIRFAQEYAGLGGDINLVRLTSDYSFYYPVGDDSTAALLLSEGMVFGLGENVRIPQRFYLGGNSFRGFRSAGIGPRDQATSDALGGTMFYTASGEYRFPLGFPKELGVLGRSFVDVGSLAKSDESGTGILDTGDPRVSAGVGMTWKTPLGPLAIDLGWALVKEPFDRTEILRISFGTRF
ncbi:MAG: outer membrane protein assembly factor BamA [Alphaproteobacteria bacterium]|nr:outer membrane protein assembly factor BamA [Alphaproteobacteria bacterium]